MREFSDQKKKKKECNVPTASGQVNLVGCNIINLDTT